MKKVLIADDDFISLEVLKAMLSAFPVEVIAVSNGTDALTQARDAQPDLCILDYEMDDMTGAEVCATLRAEAAFVETPIVALTGHQSQTELDRCRSAGMNQTLHKPVAPDALEQLLSTHNLLP
ncbi:response regulator [Aliidiomarina sanyensis]|uniref:Two-component system response regulator n=1 Tax=Aliidiomarina sanyensis TaxID=1249555 RepID=A0A432WNG3_9GAMM|nr:response regulator [Aliidiomarina sanyensis]RUO35278.1 two-component system response regulator [Aliidiomarina sanyensis]